MRSYTLVAAILLGLFASSPLRASEAGPGFAYKPCLEVSDLEIQHPGIRIVPIPISYNSNIHLESTLEAMKDALPVKTYGFSPGAPMDANPISSFKITVTITPKTEYQNRDSFALGPLDVTIDLTSASQMEWSDEGKGADCGSDIIAAIFYSILLNVNPPNDRPMTLQVKYPPKLEGRCPKFDGVYHWDKSVKRLVEPSLSGFVLTKDPQFGFICHRKQ